MEICSPQLGLSPASTLGGEVFDHEILRRLAKRGVGVSIILPKNKPYDKTIANWRVTHLPIAHFPAILFNLFLIPYLFIIYRRQPFPVIRLHQPQFTAIAALIFKMFHPQIKTIATYHQLGESNFLFLSHFTNHFFDAIICDSRYVKKKICQKYQIDPAKVTVVHNGVPKYLKPEPKDKQLTKKLHLEGKVVLLFMGLFIERKNPLFLLEVLSLLAQKGDQFVLVFWGQGPLREKIKDQVQKLQVDRMVRFVDPVFGKDKNKIHNIADIFIHPARDEGFALAPLEAMACAKPVVITKGYSAQEAVKDGVNGFLCAVSDAKKWAQKINQLATNLKLRKQMGQASLARAKSEFQWKIAVEKHYQVLKKLANP